MNAVVGFDVSWAILITYLTTITVVCAYDSPKSEVEQVPGIILPRVPNQICMHRKHYECRWTYESSCSCNPLPIKIKRFLGITFIRMKVDEKKAKTHPATRECKALNDRCIQMAR